VSGASRLAPAALPFAQAAAGAGCEYFRDTPEQDLANRRGRECAGDRRDVKLERVETDGRIRFTYVALNERDRITECLEAAGRLGSPSASPGTSRSYSSPCASR
jgi:hypothetical protein